MNEKPISHDEIFNQLDEFQAMDCKYSDGRILGSMCTEAHPIAKEAFFKFIDSNLGDPGLFKGTKLLEDKVLNMIGSFLSIEDPVGHMVTGGTEANIMAIRSARNIARDNNVIFCFFKIKRKIKKIFPINKLKEIKIDKKRVD